jgi:hypothetical protein
MFREAFPKTVLVYGLGGFEGWKDALFVGDPPFLARSAVSPHRITKIRGPLFHSCRSVRNLHGGKFEIENLDELKGKNYARLSIPAPFPHPLLCSSRLFLPSAEELSAEWTVSYMVKND